MGDRRSRFRHRRLATRLFAGLIAGIDGFVRSWTFGARHVTGLVLCASACIALGAAATDKLPSAPARYFNDYAGVTKPPVQEQLNRELEQFEKDQSSQIVVAIFPRLPEGAALEDFTYRTATAWKVGRAGLNNGAVLFLFVADRKMRIEIGYGLEGKVPDAIAKRIISEQIRPHLQQGDYDGAMTAGVQALMQAARGEYRGTGTTVAQGRGRKGGGSFVGVLFALFVLFAIISAVRRSFGGSVYGRRGYSGWGAWSGGGGGSSGGGFSGGGFSGGGGSFGGGGASGSW